VSDSKRARTTLSAGQDCCISSVTVRNHSETSHSFGRLIKGAMVTGYAYNVLYQTVALCNRFSGLSWQMR
jgi:hypothetical protein